MKPFIIIFWFCVGAWLMSLIIYGFGLIFNRDKKLTIDTRTPRVFKIGIGDK